MPGRGNLVDYYTDLMSGFQSSTSLDREVAIERMYIRILSELCMNRFKWEGLPESINVRYLELTLFRFALSVFYKDRDYGYVALQGSPAGIINLEQEPTAFQVTGPNFTGRLLNAFDPVNELVPIWANYLRTPDLDIVRIYANKLANFDRTVEINSKNARQPKAVASNANQKLTYRNIARQQDQGVEVIEFNPAAIPDLSGISVLDLGINPDTIEKLDVIRARQWNVAMGLLGIENANQDKKERLVADEVSANNDQTVSMRFVNLNARQLAAEQISKFTGQTVTVEYNTQIAHMAEQLFLSAIDSPDVGAPDDGTVEDARKE